MSEQHSTTERIVPYPVKFYPLPFERLWGGHDLKDVFRNRCGDSMATGPVGEYWLLSEHPHGTSVVANGPLAGRTLADLTEAYPAEYLGASPQSRFPLLIKVLEAAEDLSVQVHPTDAYARVHEGDFGKTEAWYVLDAQADGTVINGHIFENGAALLEAAQAGKVRRSLTYRSIMRNDVVFVPSGTLHALRAGTKVVEVQQTSDVTYRVFDWNRVGDDGQPRQLHLEQAVDVLFPSDEFRELHAPRMAGVLEEEDIEGEGGEYRWLLQCGYFSLVELQVEQEQSVTVHRETMNSPDVLIIIAGRGGVSWDVGGVRQEAGIRETLSVESGDAVLVPTSIPQLQLLAADGPMKLLWVRYGRRRTSSGSQRHRLN